MIVHGADLEDGQIGVDARNRAPKLIERRRRVACRAQKNGIGKAVLNALAVLAEDLRYRQIHHARGIFAQVAGLGVARNAYDLPRALDRIDADLHRMPDRISIWEEFACDGLVYYSY